jgi:hypothetical protein
MSYHRRADGPLPLAKRRLADAVAGLCAPQWQDRRPLDPRYTQLRDAMAAPSISGHRRNTPSSLIPAQIDALKLVLLIDARTHVLTAFSRARTTPNRLRELAQRRTWRPQDCDQLKTIAGEIESWATAIDDLFAAKPIPLPNPCPHCRQTHTHVISDEGEHVQTAALTISADRGAECHACHDVWPPDRLLFLGRTLGYLPAGVTA